MVENIKEWERLTPGEVQWEAGNTKWRLLHKVRPEDESGITIWRTLIRRYYTVELWTKRGKDGFPIWGNPGMETSKVRPDWNRAESEYKRLVRKHGGL